MHSVEKVTPENIYFAVEFTTLSTLEPELWPFMEFGSHFGSHLGFVHFEWSEVLLMYTVGKLIPKNIYFATNFMKLSALEP